MDRTGRGRASAGTDLDARHVADLRADLARTDLVRHLALFYETRDRQLESVAAYVDHGLRTGHRCVYLTDSSTESQVKAALWAADVDVSARVDAGDLSILDAPTVYLDAGFDPDRMIATLEAECHESVNRGYDGLWAAGENTWCFHTDEAFDHVLEFEVQFDDVCPDLPVTALCQYDLSRFGERSTAKALWTHEQIIYRNSVCENPYYVSPQEYMSTSDPHLNARLMLEQTYDLNRAQREVDRREQRLAVVDRILRHNVRNDLNVIRGNLELLRENDRLDEESRRRLETTIRHAQDVVDTAEKARYVQRTVGDTTVGRSELGPVLERTIARVKREHPTAEIAVSGDPTPIVRADRNLEAAFVELLTNAIVHQDREPPTASVVVSTVGADVVRVDVRNPGLPIPESDRRALQEGYETPLEHGSGLGLWLVKWVVENAGGVLSFPEDANGECCTRLQFHRVRE